ncbi:MAG: 2Fe-2S iron-sulfur cluster-binding protein [Pseudomonadales bacterium]
MPVVTFIHPDGTRQQCRVARGQSVMDAALDNDVPGIRAQCGGGCTCATCHCYVLSPAVDALPLPHPDEVEMLAYVWQPRPNSRLACQLRLDGALTEIVVAVPAEQA